MTGDVISDQLNGTPNMAVNFVNKPPSHTLAGSIVNSFPSQVCNRNKAGTIVNVGGDVVSDQTNRVLDLVEEDIVNVPPNNALAGGVVNTNTRPIKSNANNKPVKISFLAPS